jgi:NitT/TauT family transport system substrate-binding protein
MTSRDQGYMPLSRRRFLKHSALAAGALAMPALSMQGRAAGSLRKVAMTLDWIYQGPNAGFMLALDKGFYRDAGLDLSLTAGKGSGSTAQLVGSKATQIGFADGYVVGNAISKGMPIRTVGSIYRRNPSAVVVFEDSDIKTPKDLEGRTIAITAGSAQFQQFPAFVKGAGLDMSKIHLINIDPAGVGIALVNGKVDAIGGYAQGYVPTIEYRSKKKTRIFYYADYGVTVVSNGIIVHDDFIKSDPDLIKAFVPPTIKGFLYGRQHPDEAVASVKKYLPTITPEISKRELELSWKTWVTPHTKGKALGWGSEQDWAATADVLHKYGGVSAPLQASQLFTNEFVPTGSEYVPPQET